MLKIANSSLLLGAAAAIALLTAGPALAQEPQDEFTIAAQGAGAHERTLSASVHHGDLDLTTRTGQSAFRKRVRRTAAELCHRIGGDDVSAVGIAFSCEDDAVEEAGRYVRAVIAQAGSHRYGAALAAESALGR